MAVNHEVAGSSPASPANSTAKQERKHAWHLQHRESENAKSRAWFKVHPTYHAEYLEKNPAKKATKRAATREWKQEHPDYLREWRAKHPDWGARYKTPEAREKYRSRWFARRAKRFGTTVEELRALEKKQRGRCAICRRKLKLVVDHDHKTEKFRGLICEPCNWALGLVHDKPEVCESMAAYLRRTPCR